MASQSTPEIRRFTSSNPILVYPMVKICRLDRVTLTVPKLNFEPQFSLSILNHITSRIRSMSQVDATVVRELIEANEPIKDIELNFLLLDYDVDPQDAIILQDILLEQERIEYNHDTHCFSTI